MRLLRHLAAMAALLLACTSGGAALADEGMWTFDNFPSAAVQAKYGVNIDKAWLDHVQASAVRLSIGCSASVVSGEGLVVTNNHCVADCSQALSTPTQDYFKQGFIAAKREDERLCPGMQAEILLTVSDVSDQVQTAADGKLGRDFVLARDAEIGSIEDRLRRQGEDPALPGDHPLPGRPVQALRLSQVFRRAAGVRAGVRHRLLRR